MTDVHPNPDGTGPPRPDTHDVVTWDPAGDPNPPPIRCPETGDLNPCSCCGVLAA